VELIAYLKLLLRCRGLTAREVETRHSRSHTYFSVCNKHCNSILLLFSVPVYSLDMQR
jgi:hypothetical protein